MRMHAHVKMAWAKITLNARAQIPDQLLNSWLTISRPLFGAMSALAISVFLLSGLIQFGDLTQNLILAISFVAGFSERFLLRAVEL